MADKQQMMADMMRGLRLRFMDQLGERREGLARLLTQCSEGGWSEADFAELKIKAHQMAGTGTTYGFPAVTDAGNRLQNLLMDHPTESPPFFRQALDALIAACDAALAAPALPPAAPLPEETAALFNAALPRLLVVDDDAMIHEMLRALFALDATLLTATNATDALEIMRREKPDLVLLDNEMPGGVSGLRLLEDIQSMPEISPIPVMMITANDSPEEVMRGLMAGAVDYIVKPFDPETILAKVRGRLSRLQSSVLIADDDAAVRDLLSHKFQLAGCKVVTAKDGEEAWKRMCEEPVALAVLDRMMPGFEGMNLLHMMKNNPALEHTPVVFLTARHYGSDVLEGFNTGAADYITKPFHPDEVVTRCLRLLKAKPEAA